MVKLNMVGRTFENMQKRYVYSFIGCYPDFIPNSKCRSDAESQKQMYDFLYGAILKIYDEPTILYKQIVKDAYIPNGMCNNESPEITSELRKIETRFLQFFESLMEIGVLGKVEGSSLIIQNEDVQSIKKVIPMLRQHGLTVYMVEGSVRIESEHYPQMVSAWKELASVSVDNITNSRRVFNFILAKYGEDQIYNASQLFGGIVETPKALYKLESFFQSNGYICSNGMKFQVDWERKYPNQKRARMQVSFAPGRNSQLSYCFIIPDFKNLLCHINELDTEIKTFVLERTKTCNGCRFCVQADKNNSRDILAVAIQYEGKSIRKCPMYPEFNWNYLDDGLASSIISMFTAADAFIGKCSVEEGLGLC